MPELHERPPSLIPVEHHLFRGALFVTRTGSIMELVGPMDGLKAVGRAEYVQWHTGYGGIIPVDVMKDCEWTPVTSLWLALDVAEQFPEATHESDRDVLYMMWDDLVNEVAYNHGVNVDTFQADAPGRREHGPRSVLTAFYQTSLDDLVAKLSSGSIGGGITPSVLDQIRKNG